MTIWLLPPFPADGKQRRGPVNRCFVLRRSFEGQTAPRRGGLHDQRVQPFRSNSTKVQGVVQKGDENIERVSSQHDYLESVSLQTGQKRRGRMPVKGIN